MTRLDAAVLSRGRTLLSFCTYIKHKERTFGSRLGTCTVNWYPPSTGTVLTADGDTIILVALFPFFFVRLQMRRPLRVPYENHR